MKNLGILILVSFMAVSAGPIVFAQADQASSKTTEKLPAGKAVKVSIKGMVCAFCAQGITKNFKSKPEVKEVDVNLDSKVVTLVMNEGKMLDDGSINEVIKDAGYKVVKIER